MTASVVAVVGANMLSMLNAHSYERYRVYAELMRLHKPIGIFLLLWPALWAIWIASSGKIDLKILVIFVLGVILMRSAGCVINDYADRDLDAHVTRTKNRPLATGAIKPKQALVLFVGICLIAFLLVTALNWDTLWMSCVAVVLAISYPFMKRYTYLPQAYLGLAFAWSIPMAYTAYEVPITVFTWLLYLAAVVWTIAYDTMYAIVDRDDDIKIGIKSSAILFGESDRLMIGIFQSGFLGILLTIGIKLDLSIFFYLGLLLATILSIYQQYLIRNREPQYCLAAFLNNNYVGLAIFAGIVAHYWVHG